MTASQIFHKLQQLHPTFKSFTYWPEHRALTINDYNERGTLITQWTGREAFIDVPSQELINDLRHNLQGEV